MLIVNTHEKDWIRIFLMPPYWRLLGIGVFVLLAFRVGAETRPNILWIVGEDASPNLGCYGETTIRTPVLDGLASKGIRFDNAFVTCPVCSPSRSALITGMYQTTLGAHNHRSQSDQGKAGGNKWYYDSYRVPVKTIPRLFKDAGYYTCNVGRGGNQQIGKTDYNFIWDESDYDGFDWWGRAEGQPFFAQVQLGGGKIRNSGHGTEPAAVALPPYYPDHRILRKDWAEYLDSWIQMDNDAGTILDRLEEENLLESTAIFFFTDHGVSHMRGKQFLYDEGMRIPLILKLPGGEEAGNVRSDLVEHIDVAVTSLTLAGIPIPDNLQGRNLLDADLQPRDFIFAARDRCDETVDTIRCVRTPRFKYIRNFLSYLPHAQPNVYKDGKPIVKAMRDLFAAGELNELQSRVFQTLRPPEELYDVQVDPNEINNLAGDPAFAENLVQLRSTLYGKMIETRDVGLIPEPILEDMGRAAKNKSYVLSQPQNEGLIEQAIRIIEAGEKNDRERLIEGLKSAQPAIRYWAVTWLGILGAKEEVQRIEPLLEDKSHGVRVAAALALGRLGETSTSVKALSNLIDDPNLVVGMYAMRGLELLGSDSIRALPSIERARQNPYEFTKRIAERMAANFSE